MDYRVLTGIKSAFINNLFLITVIRSSMKFIFNLLREQFGFYICYVIHKKIYAKKIKERKTEVKKINIHHYSYVVHQLKP